MGNAEEKAVRNEEPCPSSSASSSAALLCLEMGEGLSSCSYPANRLAVVLPVQSPTCYELVALFWVVNTASYSEAALLFLKQKLFPNSLAQRLF